ncbi:MAG: DMT family transporter [Bacteroidales bacterium]|nr:DMT family transporter [Bacteroidales bacterium]
MTTFKSNLLLFVTAIIWGLAFVAQRAGMEDIGPFAFNGIRFALGSISLLPLIYLQQKRKKPLTRKADRTAVVLGGLVAGTVLFAGASLQQVGMVYTTAGNGGFITSLYVIIVPVLGLFWRHKISKLTWIGGLLAVLGLYFLSVTESFSLVLGDALVLASAFFWAGHVLLIGHYSKKTDVLVLAAVQFAVVAVLSLLVSGILETTQLENVRAAAIPILYGGLMSVGVAYTLQVIAQQKARPAHAAIILSLESLFAAAGGILILNEPLSIRIAFGGLLMLSGVVVSQLKPSKEQAGRGGG